MSKEQNVKIQIQGDLLTIRIDLTQDFGLSSTGKTVKIASTNGFLNITDKIILSLNCNKKK